jgi:hypothetical protein
MREHAALSPSFDPVESSLLSAARALRDVRGGLLRLTILSLAAASVAGLVAFTGWVGIAAAGAALFGACVAQPRAEVWLVLTTGTVSPVLAEILVKWL